MPNVGEGHFGYSGIERTIAINADQYAGSQACGTCVEVWGNGRLCPHGIQGPDCGLGQQENAFKRRFLAVITDELWERGYGDIDVGVHGDGKYPVQWKPVPCPWDKSMVRIVLHTGASRNYIKIQFRYMDSGMRWVRNEGVRIGGRGEESRHRYHDNYFVFQRGGDGLKGWDSSGMLNFRSESNLGSHYCGQIDKAFRGEPYEYMAWPC